MTKVKMDKARIFLWWSPGDLDLNGPVKLSGDAAEFFLKFADELDYRVEVIDPDMKELSFDELRKRYDIDE